MRECTVCLLAVYWPYCTCSITLRGCFINGRLVMHPDGITIRYAMWSHIKSRAILNWCIKCDAFRVSKVLLEFELARPWLSVFYLMCNIYSIITSSVGTLEYNICEVLSLFVNKACQCRHANSFICWAKSLYSHSLTSFYNPRQMWITQLVYILLRCASHDNIIKNRF